jgi:hypothetical protein
MAYDRFASEDELLKSILPFGGYPKVTAIAGKRINPDIDMLKFYTVSHNQYRLDGYEVKLVKFDQRSKSLSWDTFYKGVGEALLYLRNGVQRTNLVLGFHRNVASDEKIDEFNQWLWRQRRLLAKILGSYMSLGTVLYKGRIGAIVEATSDFSSQNDDTRFLSQALLQKRFTYDKRLQSAQ